ncbi:hypothetical protein [Desulforamulus reducens]|uniref:hypothetical protein n=1 Tax=Desulforamulus reducens TaxID=59610 RepID=UPI00059C368C|nr:hypothetical protein [Desulforamulus reducens]
MLSMLLSLFTKKWAGEVNVTEYPKVEKRTEVADYHAVRVCDDCCTYYPCSKPGDMGCPLWGRMLWDRPNYSNLG